MTGTKSKISLFIRSENDLYISHEVCLPIDSNTSVEVTTNRVNIDEVCLRIDSDISIEAATNRVFVVGHKLIIFDLKKLVHSFDIRWNVCTLRSGMVIKCNRATRFVSRVSEGLRKITSIICGCK